MPRQVLGQRSFDDYIDDRGVPLAETTFCILDFETTGGSRSDDMITEIGVVKVRGGECLGTFHTLINPGRAIPPQITVLTGLTDAVVATAPRIESVLGTLLDFVGGGVFVAHNASFDLGFLRAALARDRTRRLPPDRRRHRRPRPPARARRGARLPARHAGVALPPRPPARRHRALDDALATTDLLHLLIERASGLGVLGLDDLFVARQAGRAPAGRQAAR